MIQDANNLMAPNRASPADWRTRLAAGDVGLHVHLIGIGGAGLGPIALVLMELGMRVSGSDRQSNLRTQELADAGARIFDAQEAANLRGPAAVLPDVVLISSAVDAANPERRAAEVAGLPVVKRAEFLPALLAGRRVIAVAGTHGKSTTTAMIVRTLRAAGIDAGYIIGTDLPGYGSAAAGSTPHFVIEADEYDHMFLGLVPAVAVITNVEWDHPDCFPTADAFYRAFADFVAGVQRDGLLIICSDDPGASRLYAERSAEGPSWLTYGFDLAADLNALNPVVLPDGGTRVDVAERGTPAAALTLQVPGRHNVLNALAALAVAEHCGVSPAQARLSLAAFGGTKRRFEFKGEAAGIAVIDDYAHHPTEVQATLSAARGRYPERRIWAVLQPHTYSRTERMLDAMARSFADADRVLVTDIYAAREVEDGGVHASRLVAASPHPAMEYVGSLAAASARLAAAVEPGDVVITLGAGDGYRVGEELLATLTRREREQRPDRLAPSDFGVQIERDVDLAGLTTMKVGVRLTIWPPCRR